MSNKTRLQTNNINLQALIDKANALPDAGSGGGSVETCTVTITDMTDSHRVFATTTIVDNNVETVYTNVGHYLYEDGGMVPPFTISNVKCGAPIVLFVDDADGSTPYVEVDGGATLIKAAQVGDVNQYGDDYPLMYVFTASKTAGANCTIVVSVAF